MFPLADIPVRVIIDAIDNASKELQGFGKNLEGIAGNMRTVGAAGVAVGAVTLGLAKGFVEQAGAMEQNQVAFETMLGSATKAKDLLQQMSDFAAKTPFQLPDVVNAGKQLLAYGFQQEKVIDTTRMLGDVAAGLNIPLGDIIYLFGTLRAQGRAYTKDLNQFTARGIPILDALAKQYGVTKSAVFDLAAEGKIGFEDINKAFQTMTGSGGQFFNLMDKQSKTTLGTWSNLQDSITRVQIALGNALLPAVNQVMDAVMPLIVQFGAWAKKNPELVKNLVIAGLAIGAIGSVLLAIGVIIPPIIAAVQLLGVVLAAVFSPIGLIIIAIIGILALLFIAWQKNLFGIRDIAQNVFSAVVGFVQGVISFFQSIPTIISQAITTTITWFNNLILFIQSIPTLIAEFIGQMMTGIYVFFTETLPFAIGFAAGSLVKFVTEDIPAFIASAIQWFLNLRTTVPALIDQMKTAVINFLTNLVTQAIAKATELYNNLVKWFTDTAKDVISAIEGLPGEIERVFNNAKEAAINKAKEIYDGVKGWFDKIIGFFRDIIDWAGKAISKAGEAASAGFNAGKRQYGGPVSAASAYVVGEAGAEGFTPQTAGYITPHGAYASKGGGRGGNTIQFIINASLIVNSPTERRSLAEALYKDLATLARSQNMTVAELMGA